MRRDSEKAKALVRLLAEADISFAERPPTGRFIERLSQDGLLPHEGATDDTVRRHFAELATLGYGPGKSADRTARVLLARGFPCERARASILRGYGMDASLVEAVLADGLSDALSIFGQAIGDRDAGELASRPLVGVSPFASDLLGSLSTLSLSGRYDYAGAMVAPLEESPDEHHRSHVRTLIEAMRGEEVTDAHLYGEAHHKFGHLYGEAHHKAGDADMSYDEDEEARRLFAAMAPMVSRMIRFAVDQPLPELATTAQMIRPAVEGILARLRGQGAREEDADDLAASLAPAFLAYAEWYANQD